MEQNINRNAKEAGTIDYKQRVRSVYPSAECIKHHRKSFYIIVENDVRSEVTRYQFDIYCDKNTKISTSTYTEEGAWEYAWYFIEQKMLSTLEQ